MAKPARHVLDVYDAVLHAATTKKQWARIRSEVTGIQKRVDSAGLTHFALWVPNNGVSVAHVAFYIDRKAHGDDTMALVNTVAHEATHGANYLLDHVGQAYSGDNSEAHAYLVAWIASWLWQHAQDKAE